jgi:hypothetical protein
MNALNGVTPAMANLEVLEELRNLVAEFRNGAYLESTQPKSVAAMQMLIHCRQAPSPAEAFFRVCAGGETDLGTFFFGTVEPIFEAQANALVATDRGRRFRMVLDIAEQTIPSSPEPSVETICLYTDFNTFIFRCFSGAGHPLKPFATFSAAEMSAEVAFVGSVWASVFPEHHALVCRTISYTFSQDTSTVLFSPNAVPAHGAGKEERFAHSKLQQLRGGSCGMRSLHALYRETQRIQKAPKLLSETREGAYTLRRYSPQRSSLFDFGEDAGDLTRGDFVTTYNVDSDEYHREFLISPPTMGALGEELQAAAFDLLHLLAIRRSKLFRLGFASYVYNVLLPPAILAAKNGSQDGCALFPCLTVYRAPGTGGFRRTLSITFIACPVTLSLSNGAWTGIQSRRAPLQELHALKDDLLAPIASLTGNDVTKHYAVGGPISSYVNLPAQCSIPEVLNHISAAVLHRIIGSHGRNDSCVRSLVDTALFTSSLESRIATLVLQVEWNPPEGFTQPWERWLATGEDGVFSNSLFRTLFYADYLAPHSADASRRALRFNDFNVGDTSGVDMTGMTLFNAQESVKLVLYPRKCERYPNHSMLRWMAWQIYIDSALTSLRALIYRVHPVLDRRRELHEMIGTLQEMVQEFVLFYDLDIRDYFYRREYKKLRALMQVEEDYHQLLSKFASAKEEASLREQRLINKLITALTLATVALTIVSTVAQMRSMDTWEYVGLALGVSLLAVCGGYLFFDPVSRVLQRIYHLLTPRR